MKHNPDKVRTITSEILSAIANLKELGALPFPDFQSDRHMISSAKYNLLVAIEGIIDLCNHVITKNCFRTPDDYADTFRVMQEHRVFSADFTESLIQMSRFRNR